MVDLAAQIAQGALGQLGEQLAASGAAEAPHDKVAVIVDRYSVRLAGSAPAAPVEVAELAGLDPADHVARRVAELGGDLFDAHGPPAGEVEAREEGGHFKLLGHGQACPFGAGLMGLPDGLEPALAVVD